MPSGEKQNQQFPENLDRANPKRELAQRAAEVIAQFDNNTPTVIFATRSRNPLNTTLREVFLLRYPGQADQIEKDHESWQNFLQQIEDSDIRTEVVKSFSPLPQSMYTEFTTVGGVRALVEKIMEAGKNYTNTPEYGKAKALRNMSDPRLEFMLFAFSSHGSSDAELTP